MRFPGSCRIREVPQAFAALISGARAGEVVERIATGSERDDSKWELDSHNITTFVARGILTGSTDKLLHKTLSVSELSPFFAIALLVG
jgi:hypothetical protein